MVVSFQENAWVDTKTHLHGLSEVMGPINEHLGKIKMKGVQFEDNLSSHNREEVFKFWRENLEHFEPPRFVPKNMTEILQVVDRHLGILYKNAIYKGFRNAMMKRLREARKRKRGGEGLTLKVMTPAEKRIMITKIVANTHEKVLRSGGCEIGFHRTATLVPVAHLECDKEGVTPDESCTQIEKEVKLQHLPEYLYTEQCPKVKVLEELKARQEKEEADRKEKAERQAEENAKREAEEEMMAPFVTKANIVKGELEKIVSNNISEVAEKIRAATGLQRFVIGGSYASLKISDACAELQDSKTDFAVEVVPLVSNDIDVFHGDFTDDSSKDLFVDKCSIQKFNVDGVELEVNTVKCNDLSPETFLANNDVNITASCIHIDFESGSILDISFPRSLGKKSSGSEHNQW